MSKYPFDLRILVYTRPNLRDESLQMEAYVGHNVLKNCFDIFKVDEMAREIFLSFPEKFTNILEQRALIQRIIKYYPNVTKVTIKTHSVYILQTVHHENIFVLDEPAIPETEEGKLYHEMIGNLFDCTKLNVVGGNID